MPRVTRLCLPTLLLSRLLIFLATLLIWRAAVICKYPSLLVSLVVSWFNWKMKPKMWAPHDGLLAKEGTIYYGIQNQYWSNVLVYLLLASTRATHFIICICLFCLWLNMIELLAWLHRFVISWQRKLFWSSSVCFEIICCLKLQWKSRTSTNRWEP